MPKDCTQANSGFSNSLKTNDMSKFLVIPFFLFYLQFAYSQNTGNHTRVNYSISDKAWDFVIDTVPATVPSDYFDFCECTGVFTLANIYSFVDVYRKSFSYKTPAKYILCSIAQIDSVGVWDKDTALWVTHTKATIYENLFSPYYLDYWNPKEDVLESEYISGSKITYNSLRDKIKYEEERKTEIKNVDVIILPREIAIIKKTVNDVHTNLFLLRIDDSEEGDIIAYQFFAKEDFDISSLYTPLQYYKFLLGRYSDYMKKMRNKEQNIHNSTTGRKQ